jgi:hypothetical protein
VRAVKQPQGRAAVLSFGGAGPFFFWGIVIMHRVRFDGGLAVTVDGATDETEAIRLARLQGVRGDLSVVGVEQVSLETLPEPEQVSRETSEVVDPVEQVRKRRRK